MSKWEISPIDEGVTNHKNGKFTFEANVPHTEYTISYTDDAGCTANYKYKLRTNCGEPPDCEKPEADGDLDTLIEGCGFETALGTEISPENTPCTYTYLLNVYDYVKFSSSNVLKSWTLANALTELTPYDDIGTEYFKGAARGYGGIGLDFNTYHNIYDERIDGALFYARYKCQSYVESQEMAENARLELQFKGITKAELRPRIHPEQSNPIFFNRDEAPHLEALIPDSGCPSNASDTVDFQDIQQLIDTYQINITNYTTPEQALADKAYCGLYLAEVMGIEDKYKYDDFIDLLKSIADAATNHVKYDIDKYKRWRPQHHASEFNVPYPCKVYLCDCNYQLSYFTCGDECNNQTCADEEIAFAQQTSFPSGHSSKMYIAFLCCVEVIRGLYAKNDRVLQYCRNRNLVRAHWLSDVIAGKFCASMQIGYLNGFEEYHKLIRNLKQ